MILENLFELKKERDFINDRRQAKRYDIMLKVDYLDPATKCFVESLAKNISRTGIRFGVNSKLQKGTFLDIKVEDPNAGRFLSLKGKVAWVEEFPRDEDTEVVRYEIGIRVLKKRLF